MTFSDFRQVRRACHGVGIHLPDHNGSPPITRTTIPTCRAHYPGGPKWVRTSVASPPARAFPEQQSGRRPQVPFRGLLRLHACYGPPDRSAAQRRPFVTRLRPGWLPDQVARQLPDQPTILWVEPPSTGVTRLRGALLSKKSKIEQLPKSRESRFLPAAASASLCQVRTKLCGRLLVIRRGPSHRRARDAPAALKNFLTRQKTLFRQYRPT